MPLFLLEGEIAAAPARFLTPLHTQHISKSVVDRAAIRLEQTNWGRSEQHQDTPIALVRSANCQTLESSVVLVGTMFAGPCLCTSVVSCLCGSTPSLCREGKGFFLVSGFALFFFRLSSFSSSSSCFEVRLVNFFLFVWLRLFLFLSFPSCGFKLSQREEDVENIRYFLQCFVPDRTLQGCFSLTQELPLYLHDSKQRPQTPSLPQKLFPLVLLLVPIPFPFTTYFGNSRMS